MITKSIKDTANSCHKPNIMSKLNHSYSFKLGLCRESTKVFILVLKSPGENWTLLSKYVQSEEFISSFREFSDLILNHKNT